VERPVSLALLVVTAGFLALPLLKAAWRRSRRPALGSMREEQR
jgi:hypothetical protein